jgi:hypothetical protein
MPVPPVRGAAEGDAPIEVLGLNKSPSLNFGEAVGLAAGLAVASVCGFLREPLALGDASGDSAIGSEALSQPVMLSLEPLCGGDLFLQAKAIQWATRAPRLFELAQRRCWRDRFLK